MNTQYNINAPISRDEYLAVLTNRLAFEKSHMALQLSNLKIESANMGFGSIADFDYHMGMMQKCVDAMRATQAEIDKVNGGASC